MGVVYEAEDTRLGRSVALKVLPEHVPRDLQMIERFRRKVPLAAALNHPNICTIYDVAEYQGQPVLVMERLSGCTFKHCLTGKPQPADKVLELGIQIAEGLAAAHANGIVHRDINAAKMLLTDGAGLNSRFWSSQDDQRSSDARAGSRSGRDRRHNRTSARTVDQPWYRARNERLHVAGAGSRRFIGFTNRSL